MNHAAIFVMLICVLLTAGCSFLDWGSSPTQPTSLPLSSPTPESKLSTIELSAMALQLSDLPDGYSIKERSDVSYAEISPMARDEGWKKGYFVSFYRMNVKNYDITGITQQISSYPPNRMTLIFDEVKNNLNTRADASISVTELPFPKTGDRTIALRSVDANDQYGIITYTVIFTKKDVLEQIEMRGTTTDYEVLKDSAQKAASKIQ
ncbi:MAG: hypothetical protein NTY71_03590 [Methanoregula sp.]|nr:hypothetical protein [Methanoregula sp.]